MSPTIAREDAPATGASAAVKTLAVTDLVDSTGLFAALGDRRAAELSARHERLARDLIVRYGGREIDKSDGFLALFDRALDAVRFAVAYHRALAELAHAEGAELEARVGIHLGEVILRANSPEDVARGAKPLEIEGFAKPLAARVTTLAKGRQTLLTRGAFDLARQAAGRERAGERELRWLAHGPYLLKGVAEPVEIFEVGEAGFAPLLVPKSTAKARRAVRPEDEATLGWRPAPGVEIPRRRHWRLAEKLGEGGFGEVWRGRHEKTGEDRVFKFCYHADRLRSLQREVTLFRLMRETLGSRRDIARILDWNFDQAPYFLESEYTEGGNLLEWVAERGGPGAVPLPTRLELVAQVAEALAAAHSVGVLHKDVKPSNVLVTTGPDGRPEVRLTDFGIGLVTDREVLAGRGITVFDLTELLPEGTSEGGTHLYMAPELVEGRPASVQADVYALGVMLYQLVAGDFSRALAQGWRRDVADELLQEDIAALVDGRPERRLRDAQEVARRLRALEERRLRREAERRAAEELETHRRAAERAQRRRKAALAIAAASLAVLAVVAVLALQAVDARREAERRRGQAEGLIGFMVGDLREKLEPIGRLDLLDEVGTRALEYFAAVPEEDLSDEELFRRTETLRQLGHVHMQRGDLPSAMAAHRESLALAAALAERDPGANAWRKGLGESHFWVGYVLWRQGDLDGALERFHSYLAVAEELTAREPENPEWQLEVAYAVSNLAAVHEARGEPERALEPLRRSLAIRARLVEAAPADRGRRMDLASAHAKLGRVLAQTGDLRGALEHHRADLEIRLGLLGERPEDAPLLHEIATSHSYVADVLENLGRLEETVQHLQRAREILAGLVERDPANSRWRRDLGADLGHLGEAYRKRGDLDRALAYLTEARAVFEELVARDATDSGWRLDLARSSVYLARTRLLLEGPEGAAADARRAVGALQALSREGEPQRARSLVLASGLLVLGRIEEQLGSPDQARRHGAHALEILQPLAAGSSDPELLDPWARALVLLDRHDEARAVASRLREMGYGEPDFWTLLEERGPPGG